MTILTVSKKSKAAKEMKPKQKQLSLSKYLQSKENVNYVCLTCTQSEEIPLSVVRDFDRMDDGDPEVPCNSLVKYAAEPSTRNTTKVFMEMNTGSKTNKEKEVGRRGKVERKVGMGVGWRSGSVRL